MTNSKVASLKCKMVLAKDKNYLYLVYEGHYFCYYFKQRLGIIIYLWLWAFLNTYEFQVSNSFCYVAFCYCLIFKEGLKLQVLSSELIADCCVYHSIITMKSSGTHNTTFSKLLSFRLVCTAETSILYH